MSDCSEVASGSGHGLATDIFSLGSVLYTMLVGGPPFESSDLLETINRIKAVLYKMPNLLSAKAQHLIMSVMRLSPDDRLTLNGLSCVFSWHNPVLHLSVCPSICLSVMLCILAPDGVQGYKLYQCVPSMHVSICPFRHFCCRMYHLATKCTTKNESKKTQA